MVVFPPLGCPSLPEEQTIEGVCGDGKVHGLRQAGVEVGEDLAVQLNEAVSSQADRGRRVHDDSLNVKIQQSIQTKKIESIQSYSFHSPCQ